MASKLDQSLDAIIGDRPQTRRARGPRRARAARAAPVGGVKKAVATSKGVAAKAAARATNRNAAKAEPAVPAGAATKIIVSNLPTDVNEGQIKEYFQQVAGPVRRIWLTYGPDGQSRGIATIHFSNAVAAGKAMEQKGTKVDGRAIKVEAIVDEAIGATAPVKTLRERATAPNAQPKKATADASKANEKNAARNAKAGRGGRRTTRGRNAGRPKKKTAEELDAEMTDYFGTGTGGAEGAAAAGGAAPAAAAPAAANAAGGDDMGMDEIS